MRLGVFFSRTVGFLIYQGQSASGISANRNSGAFIILISAQNASETVYLTFDQ